MTMKTILNFLLISYSFAFVCLPKPRQPLTRLETATVVTPAPGVHFPRSTSVAKEDEAFHYIAHKGRAAYFMPFWPTIITFTMIQGWTPEHTKRMERAVQRVVEANPVLAGKVEQVRGHQGPVIRVVPSDHDAFFQRTVGMDLPSPKGLTDGQLLKYMDQHIAHLVPPIELVGQLAKDGKNLFEMQLIELPDNHAVYIMRLAHCLGDGVTYYHLMQQLACAFEGKESLRPRIDWDNPAISTHEIYPPEFNEKDFQASYGIPFMVGAAKNSWNLSKRSKGYLLLDADKIEIKRKELCDTSKHKVLSVNDIVTSSLCGAVQSSDVLAFTMDMRGKNRHLGGNFHREVPFDREAVKGDPNKFRDILQKGFFYKRGRVPLRPAFQGRIGRITSLATVEKWIEGEDQEVLCHCVPKDFVDQMPIDIGVVFRMNKRSYLCLHNFLQLDATDKLLSDLVVDN